jgi:hypothetical protein
LYFSLYATQISWTGNFYFWFQVHYCNLQVWCMCKARMTEFIDNLLEITGFTFLTIHHHKCSTSQSLHFRLDHRLLMLLVLIATCFELDLGGASFMILKFASVDTNISGPATLFCYPENTKHSRPISFLSLQHKFKRWGHAVQLVRR